MKLRAARVVGALGLLGVALAIVFYLIARELNFVVFFPLLIGLALLAAWLSLAPDDLRGIITRRQAVYGSNTIIGIALLAGAISVLYLLTLSANVVADLTQYRTYSLRPDVAALVKGITRPAVITVFYTSRQLDQLSADQPILRMFADAAPPKIALNIVDPDAQPLIAQAFGASSAQRVFVTDAKPDGSADTTPGRIVAVPNNVVGEQQLADALLLLQARGQFNIVFTIGHDEVNTKDNGGDASALWNGLRGQGFTVSTVDLSVTEIPANTTTLVMLAPKKDLTAQETDRVSRYLANGGTAVILAEPNLYINSNTAAPPLEYAFLQESSPFTAYLRNDWGLIPQNDIVYDPDPGSFVDSQFLLLSKAASKHPILYLDKAGTRQLTALFSLARSFSAAPDAQTPNIVRTPLFKTSDKAFGATQIRQVQFDGDNYKRGDKDLSGPFILAWAASNSTNGARLVIVGDVDWARNDSVSLAGNAAFWSNTVDWLTQYTQKTSVSPTVRPPPLVASAGTLNTVVVITLVILPGLILLAGAAVWWDRARR
jgi:ABC-type uncharacterized transport system involved in gliding motility auxiliary subunit